MSDPEAIIFDMDGVLLDSIPAQAEAWRRVFRQHDLAFNKEIFQRYNGSSTADIAARVVSDYQLAVSAERIMQEKHAEEEQLLQRIELFGDTKEVLQKLNQHYALALATSARAEMLEYVEERFGLQAHFDAVVDADMVTRSKPDPDIFLTASQKLDIAPERCMVVEDAVNGILAARRAGMQVTAITTTSDAQTLNEADRVINRLSELIR